MIDVTCAVDGGYHSKFTPVQARTVVSNNARSRETLVCMYIHEKLTIANTTSKKTHDGKAAVEDTVGGIRKHDILCSTSTKVRYGAEHAHGSKTCYACAQRVNGILRKT